MSITGLTKVVIIIPTYNEGLVIEETLIKIFDEASHIKDKDIHVLIFDSCSTDNTQQVVTRLQNTYPKLHLTTELQKTGLGNAYLQAMNYALNELNAEVIFEFDADLSHQPKYIGPILKKMESNDAVIGSRYVKGGSIPKEWGLHRKLLSVLGNYIARFILCRKYKDFTSGFRATSNTFLKKVLPKKFLSNHYAYKIQLLWLLHKSNARIYEYPIEFIDREKGQSKLPANSIIDSLRVILLLRFFELQRYFKMCIIGFTGVVLQFIVYNLLRLTLSPFFSIQLAVVSAIISNFLLNNRYTFHDNLPVSKAEKIKSMSLFIAYSLLMVSLQGYWLHLGVKYFGAGYLKENVILMTGILLGSILNYFTYSRIIWSPKNVETTF